MNENLERPETINFVLSAIVSARWLHYRFISAQELLQLIKYEAEPLIVLLWYKARIQQGPAQVVPMMVFCFAIKIALFAKPLQLFAIINFIIA